MKTRKTVVAVVSAFLGLAFAAGCSKCCPEDAARAARDAELVAAMKPKCMTARKVKTFDQKALVKWFRENQLDFNQRERFGLCEHYVRPSTEICWDVCRDENDILHVSLFYYDLGKGEGAGDQNSIEFGFAPYRDCYAFLQCGVTGTSPWTHGFWPFRDGRPNRFRQFTSQIKMSYHSEEMRELTERMVTLSIPVSVVSAPESKGLIGFNMMRCNLMLNENATWNSTCGCSFSDASGFGFLRLDDSAPMPEELPQPKPLKGKVQLQIEYDWPDEMVGCPYTLESLRKEFELLKRYGVGRIYWIDYPDLDANAKDGKTALPFSHNPIICRNELQTFRNFGNRDTMYVACETAKKLGLEFYVVIKPFDLASSNAFCVKEGPKYGFRRNPEWTDPQGPKQVKKLSLVRDGDKPFEFDIKAVKVFTSMDNVEYKSVSGVSVAEKTMELPDTVWTPAGNRETGGKHKVRVLEFTGFPEKCSYVAFEFPKGDYSFRNLRYELIKIDTDKGPVRGMCTALKRRGKDAKGYEFIHDGAAAGWSDAVDSMDRVYGFSGGRGEFAVALSEIPVRHDMLDPTFPEVRKFWCDYFVKRAIDAGVDGLDVRVANHRVASDWLAYCYAEPVLAAFKAKYNRKPECTPADYEALRRIRGEGYTQFLREAGAMLRKAGKKFEAHVEARMKTDPSLDGYQGIHYDWATWIDEKIVDAVNLKYLGPFNRFVLKEIMPRAEKAGVRVQQISAYGNPRRHPRSWEENVMGMELCRLGGVSAYNLYEAWIYLRTAPGGENMIRGSALQIFEALKPYAR